MSLSQDVVTYVEIPEAWMPMIRKHNNRKATQQHTTLEDTTFQNREDQNAQSQQLKTCQSQQRITQQVNPII